MDNEIQSSFFYLIVNHLMLIVYKEEIHNVSDLNYCLNPKFAVLSFALIRF